MIEALLCIVFGIIGWPIAKAFQEGGALGRFYTSMFIAVACAWTVRDILTNLGVL